MGVSMMDDTLTGINDPQTSAAPPMIDPGIAAIQATMQQTLPPMHQDAGPSEANAMLEPNPQEFAVDLGNDEQLKLLAAALYGRDFPPIIGTDEQPEDWSSWVRGRWAAHRAAVEKHIHLIERNRLFRAGQQWVSSKNQGPWKEPVKPTDSSRIVCNLIGPALDQRLQIVADQRPGFHVEAPSSDPDEKRKAEARQLALEYQYDQQNMIEQKQVAGYWAETDGVSFWHTFWDPDRGPWDERMGNVPNEKKPLGDLNTQTLRVEQVRVSANATRTEKPYYVIIRELIPGVEAAYRYGVAGVNPNNTNLLAVGNQGAGEADVNRWVLDQTTVGEGERLRDQETVERFTLYVAPQPDILPEGLQLVVVGDAVIWGPGPLLFKTIPVIPVRDGSTDPSYYPRPQMEQWIDPQMRINAAVSAWVDCLRANKGGRFISRPGAIVAETFVGGGTSVMEVNGGIGNLDDVIKTVPSFSIGQDTKDLIAFDKKNLEDMTGYNDQSRGQISGDASGRAILAAREQLERVFAPGVQALAQSFTEWGKVNVAGMAFGYDLPRDLGTVGNGRPDLARALTRQDFDGPTDLKVEAETLMPMPRAYRQFKLDAMLDKGLITPQQYLRRQDSAILSNLETPDEDQEARAQRIAEAIRLGQPVPEMRWQDNEAIHQDVLERSIILQDDLEPAIIAAAQQRWSDLAQQALEKTGGAMPPSPAGGPGGPPAVPPNTPGTQPLASANPSIGASPLGTTPMTGTPSDQEAAAREFERTSPQ